MCNNGSKEALQTATTLNNNRRPSSNTLLDGSVILRGQRLRLRNDDYAARQLQFCIAVYRWKFGTVIIIVAVTIVMIGLGRGNSGFTVTLSFSAQAKHLEDFWSKIDSDFDSFRLPQKILDVFLEDLKLDRDLGLSLLEYVPFSPKKHLSASCLNEAVEIGTRTHAGDRRVAWIRDGRLWQQNSKSAAGNLKA
jgi:hypothetical protein